MEDDRPKPKLTDQLLQLWGRLSTTKRMAALVVLGATVFGVGFLRCAGDNTQYRVLYNNLSASDASAVVSKLRAQDIRYKLAGNTISVPAGQLDEIRLSMAADGGLPSGGVGFEVFDDQGFGTTSFVEKVNYRRALQGELARTISSLAAVGGARVHIALGQRSLFRESEKPPTASVALRLRSGKQLSRAQVRGIVNLVASSVEGLAAERVVVVDQRGAVLTAGGELGGSDDRRDTEQVLEQKIRGLIERVVGPGNVKVAVTAKIDNHQRSTTEERYDRDKTALRSEVVNQESVGGAAGTGGVAGARGNLPGAAGAKAKAGDKGIIRSNQTRNYDVSRVVTRTIGPKTQVRRLHVAVLVNYAQPAADDEAGKATPLEAGVLARIDKIAREAAGIDKARGDSIEVHNLPFAPGPAIPEMSARPGPPPFWMNPKFIIQGAIALLVFILAAIFLLRRKPSAQTMPATMVLPAPVHEVERALAYEPEPAKALGEGGAYDRVVDATRADTQKAARVLQSWLHQGGAEGNA